LERGDFRKDVLKSQRMHIETIRRCLLSLVIAIDINSANIVFIMILKNLSDDYSRRMILIFAFFASIILDRQGLQNLYYDYSGTTKIYP
jgi:hypothetical protein